MSQVGTTIVRAMRRAKMSQSQLAETAGVTRSWVASVNTGKTIKPSPVKLGRVATALGLDINQLLAMTDQLGAAPQPVPAGAQSDVALAMNRQTAVLEEISRTLSELVGALVARDDPRRLVEQVVAELRATVPALSVPGVSLEPPSPAAPRRGRK